jgi:hypothetical protein
MVFIIMSTDSQTSPNNISGNYSLYKSIGEENGGLPIPNIE